MNITFYIEKFSVWYEGLDEQGREGETKPVDLSFLPAMTRRRLGDLEKLALFTAYKCFDNNTSNINKNLQVVFASRYGELSRSIDLMREYYELGEVSPTKFSMSVHNASVAIFSLLNKLTENYTSIAAMENTFSAGLLEAVLLAQKADTLYICADENIPVFLTEENKNPYSFSMLIKNTRKNNAIGLSLEIVNENKKTSEVNKDIFDFLNFLHSEKNEYYVGCFKLTKLD